MIQLLKMYKIIYLIRQNTGVYFSYLKKLVLLWIERGKLLEFPISGNKTLCHAKYKKKTNKQTNKKNKNKKKTRRNQSWLSENLCDISIGIEQLNSSDCNTLDYFVWSVVKRMTNKTSSNIKAFTKLNKETDSETCRRFWIRLEVILKVNCDFIEWM